MEKENPKITVSFTRKFNVAQYESFDLHIGLSDCSAPGEDRKDAWKRIEAEVYKEFIRLIDLFESKKLRIGG